MANHDERGERNLTLKVIAELDLLIRFDNKFCIVSLSLILSLINFPSTNTPLTFSTSQIIFRIFLPLIRLT